MFGYMYIRTKPQSNTEKAMLQRLKPPKKNNPGYPFDMFFVDRNSIKQFKSEMLIGKLVKSICVARTIIISCLGLFRLAALYSRAPYKRNRNKKGTWCVCDRDHKFVVKGLFAIGICSQAIIAFPLSWWFMHKWLENYAYRISISWWVFVLAGLLA
jgi:hypothetical protein